MILVLVCFYIKLGKPKIFCLSSFQHDPKMCTKNKPGQSKGNIISTSLANTTMVPTGTPTTIQTTIDNRSITTVADPCPHRGTTPVTKESATNGLSFIRNTFTQQNLSADITDILMASWRRGNQAQYKTYVEKWLAFCDKMKINNCCPKISEALEFLNSLYKQGLSYSTINTARSALSAILNVGEHTFGSHPFVARFFKGLYEINKPEPKYKYIWDVNTVLKHLKTIEPLEQISLKELTLKLVMLLLLATGQRGQSIYLLSLEGMAMRANSCTFELMEHIKTSKPNKSPKPIEIRSFQPDKTLCPLTALKAYIQRTEPLRNTETKLFISFIQPHKGVSRDTISRWTKSAMKAAGIDTSRFMSHSTRAAVYSKSKDRAIPLDVIFSTAGWADLLTLSINFTTGQY